jgi:predicted DNA-binding protein with PD1-like motif
MSWKLIGQSDGTRTYVVVAQPDEDALGAIGELAAAEHLTAAQLTAVGAFSRAVVGWFDRASGEYKRVDVDQQCEVLSLVGDIVQGDDGPSVHAHAVLGLADGHVRAGHLLEGQVWPTLEVVVRETAAELRKTYRPDVGLALIDLPRSSGL